MERKRKKKVMRRNKNNRRDHEKREEEEVEEDEKEGVGRKVEEENKRTVRGTHAPLSCVRANLKFFVSLLVFS